MCAESEELTDIVQDPFCCRRRRRECLCQWCVDTVWRCRGKSEPRRNSLDLWCCTRRRTRAPTSNTCPDSCARYPTSQQTTQLISVHWRRNLRNAEPSALLCPLPQRKPEEWKSTLGVTGAPSSQLLATILSAFTVIESTCCCVCCMITSVSAALLSTGSVLSQRAVPVIRLCLSGHRLLSGYMQCTTGVHFWTSWIHCLHRGPHCRVRKAQRPLTYVCWRHTTLQQHICWRRVC